MITIRLVVPPDQTEQVAQRLVGDEATTNVLVQLGAGRRPEGDLVQCDVTREAASEVLSWVRSLGLYDTGSVVVTDIASAPSKNARATEAAAAGAPDDAIVWDQVLDGAYGEARGSWSYYAFLTLAVAIASVAVITDSAILVVGAMVVGPEFGVVAALAVGLASRRPELIKRSFALLVKGFVVAIVIATVLAVIARATGLITLDDVTGARPLTGFIWRPDVWSAVVAVLAGTAGVLSQTAGKANALVGVFISVTTVPAAGDFALSLALGATDQMAGSAAQLGINLLGMTLAGVLTLVVQRALWRVVPRRRRRDLTPFR